MTRSSSFFTIWVICSLSTLYTASSLTNTKSSLLKRYPYLDWIRSPTPLNVYPKIFQRIIPRDSGRSKKSATSHSTNWGKRSIKTSNPWTKNPKKKQELQLHSKIIQRGLKRSSWNKEVAKRMWLPQQEVYKSTARVPPMEKNGNEKKEHVILSRVFGKIYKKLMQEKPGPSSSLPVAAAQLFFLSKHPGTGRRRKRRMGMIQKNNILEEENMPLTMSNILNNCDVADELSPRLCFYILKNSEGKLHSVCAGGCLAEERRADFRKKKGSSMDSLNGGSGKKFRKIFVRI